MAWNVVWTDEAEQWVDSLSQRHRQSLFAALDRLEESGPALTRPIVGEITGSKIHNLKELVPSNVGGDAMRLLFAFAPDRSAVLLVGGIKGNSATSGKDSKQWKKFYRSSLPAAERLFAQYVEEHCKK